MYEICSDPYCYPGTTILRNRLGLRDQAQFGAFEALITANTGESRREHQRGVP